MPWFRVDSDWWMTEWLVCLSAEARLAWILLIGHVKANGERGRAKSLSPQVAARVWMIGEESVRQLLIAAENAGAITKDDGDWVVTKWRDYQTDPTHAERQAEYRERKKTLTTSDSDVTSRDSHSRHVTEVTLTGQDRTLQENNPCSPLNDPKPKRERFTPPTAEAVASRASDIGLPMGEAKKFFAHYESNGWKVGKAPMKSWRAALDKWKCNWEDQSGHANSKPASPQPITVEQAQAMITGEGLEDRGSPVTGRRFSGGQN